VILHEDYPCYGRKRSSHAILPFDALLVILHLYLLFTPPGGSSDWTKDPPFLAAMILLSARSSGQNVWAGRAIHPSDWQHDAFCRPPSPFPSGHTAAPRDSIGRNYKMKRPARFPFPSQYFCGSFFYGMLTEVSFLYSLSCYAHQFRDAKDLLPRRATFLHRPLLLPVLGAFPPFPTLRPFNL